MLMNWANVDDDKEHILCSLKESFFYKIDETISVALLKRKTFTNIIRTCKIHILGYAKT